MSKKTPDLLQRAARIRLAIFDVDGVLTDGRLIFGDNGQEYKAFNSKDGHGMRMLLSCGIEIGIITGRSSNVVKLRMENLGVKHLYQGERDKIPAFKSLSKRLGLDYDEVAYVGDDLLDIPVMQKVGLAIAVGDAHPLVKQNAHWKTKKKGGKGAVREVCELLLEAQGKLASLFQDYQ